MSLTGKFGRRRFLAAASGLAAVGAAGARPLSSNDPATKVRSARSAPDEQARLRNLAFANRAIRRCLRKHQMAGYLSGHARYNLGAYPAAKPWEITDEDERRLDELTANGIELIQVHSQWADELRLFGGDKYRPANEKGFRRFVDACHRRGLKIIPYVSASYFPRRDPDFRPEWALQTRDYTVAPYDLAHCSPAAPTWRNYLLPRIRRVLDDYGVDGVYNDVGYGRQYNQPAYRAKEEIDAFEESRAHHGAFEDLLGEIYDDVKRRCGLVKLHAGLWYRGGGAGAGPPPADRPLYDYMWVGESIDDLDSQREQLRKLPPYLIPQYPNPALLKDPKGKVVPAEIFLFAMPYMQFPILECGKEEKAEPRPPRGGSDSAGASSGRNLPNPMAGTGEEHEAMPGRGELKAGSKEYFDRHYQKLRLYQRMVAPGSWAFLEIADSDLLDQPLPSGVVASAFVNEGFYLLLANYGKAAASITLRDRYADLERGRSEFRRGAAVIPPRSLMILQKT